MATSGRSAGHISRETTNPGKSHFPGSHISREAGMGSAFYMGDGKDSVGSSTAAADVASLSSFSSSTTNSNSSASDAVTVAFPGKAVRVVEGSVNGNLKSSADVEAVGSLVASISTQSSSSEGESIPIIDISGDEPEVQLVYFKSCTYAEAAAKGKAKKQGRPVTTAAALKAGHKRTSPKANSLKSQ